MQYTKRTGKYKYGMVNSRIGTGPGIVGVDQGQMSSITIHITKILRFQYYIMTS